MNRAEIIAAIITEATNSNCPAETAARVLGIDEDTWEDVADEIEAAFA